MTYAHGLAIPLPGQKPGTGHIVPVSGVQKAIARASERTGVDFSYLMSKAEVESSMNPNAKAKTSTATGLYQFIETTWLQMVRDHGDKYGLGKYAKHIDENCRVGNARVRQAILDLRKDPETSACMAAEYAAQNAAALESRVGDITPIGETELYLAHFMGPTGAAKFIEAMHANPNRKGTAIFPQEAQRNTGVFYNRDTGRPRTLQEIYNFFDQKFDHRETNINTAQIQEEDMISALRNQRPVPSRTNSITAKNMATSLPESSEQFIGTTTDTVAMLEPEMVDRLLAHPPKALPAQDEQDKAKPLQQQLAELRQQNHQARVLVLAQLMAHEDSDRYNS